MADLLLEVGVEELPASFVAKAARDLASQLQTRLSELGLLGDTVEVPLLATPRRLIISLPGLLDRQPDTVKELRGPALKAAYDADGKPTKALEGFCRGQGVDVSAVRRDDQYVWVTKEVAGVSAIELLQEVLPTAIRSIPWSKSMRWGTSRMRFARPIRWLLATLGGEVVPFEIEGIVSGSQSRGHRFYAPEAFTARTINDLVAGLRERFVEPDPTLRSDIILQQCQLKATGTPEITEDLLQENVYLTEWPTVIAGEFNESFLRLPEPVLVTAMAKHEKMFPVRQEDGRLTNQFLFVRNSGVDEDVRRGCQWVLNARFNDAAFFYDQDIAVSPEEFLARTERIGWHEGLGTVRDQVERLKTLVKEVASTLPVADRLSSADLTTAAHYAKADLGSGLVSELPALQGVIGALYFQDHLSSAARYAVANQYRATAVLAETGGDLAIPEVQAALLVALTEQVDRLVSYVQAGVLPKGTSDPFGLRRAANIVVEIALAWPHPTGSLRSIFDAALDAYPSADRARTLEAIAGILVTRYEATLSHFSHDTRLAALASADVFNPRSIRFRCEVVEGLRPQTEVTEALRRPLNLVRKENVPRAELNEANLESAEGTALLHWVESHEPSAENAVAQENAVTLQELLLSAKAPVNEFLDRTMVMVDDQSVRTARLQLLRRVADVIQLAGDLTQLEG